MQKVVYEIGLSDGRIFRVYCDNSNQITRFLQTIPNIPCKYYKPITNGIHTIKQWEQITKEL